MAIRNLNRNPVPAFFTRFVVLGVSVSVQLTLVLQPLTISDAPRENHLSVVGLLAPEAMWTEPSVFVLGVVAFLGGIALWMLPGRATVGAILAVTGLGLLVSFRVENLLYAQHQLFQPFTVLAVLAAATAMQRGSLELPAWVWTAVAVSVGWGYTLAGGEKLVTSGPAWGDGTALRVWLRAFADENPVTDWLVATPWVAAVGMSTVLVVETTAVIGLGFRLTRVPYALALLSFHLVLEWLIGLLFFGNEFILIALVSTVLLTTTSEAEAGSCGELDVGFDGGADGRQRPGDRAADDPVDPAERDQLEGQHSRGGRGDQRRRQG